jgi:hypothetical protein
MLLNFTSKKWVQQTWVDDSTGMGGGVATISERTTNDVKMVGPRRGDIRCGMCWYMGILMRASYVTRDRMLCSTTSTLLSTAVAKLPINVVKFLVDFFLSHVINPFWWLFPLKIHAFTIRWKNKCHLDSLLIWKCKSFYLSNGNSNFRSVFTNKSVSTRSLKLASMLVYFEKLF